MQKNKFVHEYIKAVCNSLPKKLVALGLVAAVGGACTVGCDNRLLASAQEEFDHVIPDDGDTRVDGNGATWVNGNGATWVNGNGVTVVRGTGYTLVGGSGDTSVVGTGYTLVDGSGDTVVIGAGGTRVIGNGRTQVDGNGQLTVPGNATIAAEGTNRVNAGERSTVYSTSSNLFTHDGTGAGIIDGGDIEFSSFTEDRLTRDVAVTKANSLTVAPGIATHIQNGTEFTIGRTAQETLENLQRAIGLATDSEQQPASSNLFVRFVSGLMSVFTYIFFGRWLGGSGGSK